MPVEPRHYVHPRQDIIDTIERIYRYRVTTTSGGNVSVRDENGDIWITPALIDKGSLRREDIDCCRAGGGVDGPHPPSSEYPFHLAVYRARPDIAAVVHAHPVALVAFSICRTPPNTALEVLESTAEPLINSQRIGTLVPMDDAAIQKLVEVFLTKKL